MIESSDMQTLQSPSHESSSPTSHNQNTSYNPLEGSLMTSIGTDVQSAARESIPPSVLSEAISQRPYTNLPPDIHAPIIPLQAMDAIDSLEEDLNDLIRTGTAGVQTGVETETGTQTGEPLSSSESNQIPSQVEQESSTSPPTVTVVMQALMTMVRCILFFWFSFFWSTFTNHMPTRQLYTVSIILLSIHSMLQKFFEYLPHLLRSIFYYIGGEEILEELHARTYSTSKLPEVAFLEKMLEGFMGHHEAVNVGNFLSVASPGAHVVGKVARTVATSATPAHSGLGGGEEGTTAVAIVKLLETPIVSIMLPTAILSVFLLLTMSMFLCMHVVFQILMGLSSYITGASRASSISGLLSSFIIWGILGMLLLETILPVICLSIGIYLSFSVGGVVWSSFLAIVCFVGLFLKYSRRAISRGLQDARSNVTVID